MGEAFPITIMKLSGRAESSSGGKDYHLVLVSTAVHRTRDAKPATGVILIKRWGKKTQWGSMEVECFDDYEAGLAAFRLKRAEKMGRDYRETLINQTKTAKTLADLKKELGIQYWSKLGADNIRHLLPEIDPAEIGESRAEPAAEFEQMPDGRYRRKEQKRRLVEEPAPSAEKQIEDAVAANPMWGMF